MTKKPHLTKGEVQLLYNVIIAYKHTHPESWNLHIVLSDDNWDREFIQLCLVGANEDHDYIGATIATMLLRMPAAAMDICEIDSMEAGFRQWRASVPASDWE